MGVIFQENCSALIVWFVFRTTARSATTTAPNFNFVSTSTIFKYKFCGKITIIIAVVASRSGIFILASQGYNVSDLTEVFR